MDLGDFERLFEAHARHDAGDTAGEHGLARARRADEQDIVPARDGDLEGAAGDRLPLYIGEIAAAFGRGADVVRRGQRRKRHQPREVVDDLRKALRREGARARYVRRLSGVARGDDEGIVAERLCGDEQRQDARHGAQRAVEREFAEKDGAAAVCPVELARRFEDADGDGEVEVRALLFQVGGGEVDGDLVGGEAPAAVFERGAHALAALLDGGVGQADQFVGGKPVVDIRFHLDGHAFQPGKCETHHL